MATEASVSNSNRRQQSPSWSSVLVFFLVAGPELWFLYWFVGLLFPNALLGRWYTAIADLALALAIVLSATWFVRKSRPGRWLVSGPRRRELGALAVLGWLAVLPACLMVHLALGTPNRYPSHCEGRESLVSEICEGRDFSMMQGRYWYERVRGPVRGDACQRLRNAGPLGEASALETVEAPSSHCRVSELERWATAPCGRYSLPSDWSCYICAANASSNDVYRELRGYDPSCSQGVGYSTVTVPLESVEAKLAGFSSVGDGWR